MQEFDGRAFVDGVISNNIISIVEEEDTPYTKGFKSHIVNELYRIVENNEQKEYDNE